MDFNVLTVRLIMWERASKRFEQRGKWCSEASVCATCVVPRSVMMTSKHEERGERLKGRFLCWKGDALRVYKYVKALWQRRRKRGKNHDRSFQVSLCIKVQRDFRECEILETSCKKRDSEMLLITREFSRVKICSFENSTWRLSLLFPRRIDKVNLFS